MAELAKVRVKTTGMHCPSCAKLVQMYLTDVEGVDSATVDVSTGMADVTYDPDVATTSAMVAAIEEAGYVGIVEG